MKQEIVDSPSPRCLIRKCTPNERSNDGGDAIRCANDAGIGRSLRRRSREGRDDIDSWRNTRATETSDRTSDDQSR